MTTCPRSLSSMRIVTMAFGIPAFAFWTPLISTTVNSWIDNNGDFEQTTPRVARCVSQYMAAAGFGLLIRSIRLRKIARRKKLMLVRILGPRQILC